MTQLFRKEVLSQKKDRLSGEVAIAVPMSWQWIGFLIFGGLAIAIIFLSLASYARVETVAGTLVPDKGVATIIPTRTGVVTEIYVDDGQSVEKGKSLVNVKSEEDSINGLSSASLVQQAIVQQDASLSSQLAAGARAASAQRSQITVQAAGLRSEIGHLQSQLSLQQTLVDSAQSDLENARGVADRGFISQRDLQAREDTYLSRRQQLFQLQQNLTVRRATLAELSNSAANITAQAQSQAANIAASRAQVAQQAAGNKGARSYAIAAPMEGRVTALTVRTGQQVNAQTSIMTIVPKDAKLRAELNVPSQAIGFVKKGQDVRLAIDAFPFQRFGTISGKVITVASSALTQQAGNGAMIAVYPVIVELDMTNILAFGREEALIPGMTLTARIVTEQQSIIEWLFEPLFAVGKR